MTDPYARPEEPERKAPEGASQDETIPIVPEAGYSGRTSPWSEGDEHTAVDPLAQPGYTNPSLGQPYPQPGPTQQQPYSQQPYPQPQAYPQPQPQPTYGYQPPAATYEQPPTIPGYGGIYEPARDPARAPAPMVPAYQVGYPGMQLLPEHPNAIPTFVLALLGFVVGLTFPIAWFLGAKGSGDMKRQPGRWRPSSMMTVGKIIGMIGTILMVLGIGFVVLLIIMLGVSS